MKRFIFILLLIIASIQALAMDEGNKVLLDSLIKERALFGDRVNSREQFIDSVKASRAELAPSLERVAITRTLGDIYFRSDIDSALTYWNLSYSEAVGLRLDDEALSIRMRMISAMPRAGIVMEAFENFLTIDTRSITEPARREYWRYAAELYYYTQQPYPVGKYKSYYLDKTIEALDSLQSFYAVGSSVRRYIVAQIHLLHNEESLAVADFIEILPQLRQRPDFYNFALWTIASYYRGRKDYRNLFVNYMLRLCISTMRTGRPSTVVMAETGRMLVEEGERSLGNSLIAEALSISDLPSGPYRYFDRSVFTAHLSEDNKFTVYVLVSIATVLAVIIVIFMFMLRRRREMVKAGEQRLEIAQERHEMLVEEMKKVNANVLSLAFLSTGQLRDYNVYVTRKLLAGQAADLAHEVESGKYMQSIMEKFYTTFDDTFLDSFPEFLDRLNELLQPDRQLSLLPDNRMTPELRIAAMIRIGIVESSRLSQALGLSINTIYTYRNRLKGRAIDRQNFDKNLQNLPFMS